MTTNYEKIKNMTVDDMAELFNDWFSCSFCEKILKYNNSFSPSCIDFCIEKRFIRIKQWLLQEAEQVRIKAEKEYRPYTKEINKYGK